MALKYAEGMLVRMRDALDDLNQPDVSRAITAVYLVAVFGSSVTQCLLHIRTYDASHFDEWWTPKAEFMQADPLFVFFRTLRSAFLKEGGLGHERRFALIALEDDAGGAEGKHHRWYFAGAPAEHDGRQLLEPRSTHVAGVAGLRGGMVYVGGDQPTAETLGRTYYAWLERLWAEARLEFRPTTPPLPVSGRVPAGE